MSCSAAMNTFLVVKIIKNINGSHFRKLTAGNTILHATSAHPQPLVQSIPYSQYLRLRRNCSTDDSFSLETNPLKLSFYIGRTKLDFHKRVGRHITSILTANSELPLGRHVRDYHRGIRPQILFLILDHIHPNFGGGGTPPA